MEPGIHDGNNPQHWKTGLDGSEAGFQLRSLQGLARQKPRSISRPDLEDAARVPYYLFFDLVRNG
jgi:hypothetical protein